MKMELLLVGRVARAHGNKGQVIVNPETDFPDERFAAGNTLVVEQAGTSTTRRIASVRFQQGRPIIALDGIETMNDAEALAGADLKVPASISGAASMISLTFGRRSRFSASNVPRARVTARLPMLWATI